MVCVTLYCSPVQVKRSVRRQRDEAEGVINRAAAVCVVFFFIRTVCVAQGLANDAMQKYLQPAELSKLDWILLGAQARSFSDLRKGTWDDFSLVTSISVYSVQGSAPIGMTFTLDKSVYIRLPQETLAKVFTDVVHSAYGILRHSLPEARIQTDIYANFVLIGTNEIVAEFNQGSVIFRNKRRRD